MGRRKDGGFPLTQSEADALIEAIKRTAVSYFTVPAPREQGKSFPVVSEDGERFTIAMYQGGLGDGRSSICALRSNGNVMLMRLCVGDSRVHSNPDGTIVHGSHLHVYREGFNDRCAVAVDIASPDFVADIIRLLDEFHVVEKPNMQGSLS